MTSRRRLWSIANNTIELESSILELFQTHVYFCFLRFLRLAAHSLFLQIYEQFQGKPAEAAVANVSNRVNLQVNLQFYQINFWDRSYDRQFSKKICENDTAFYDIM